LLGHFLPTPSASVGNDGRVFQHRSFLLDNWLFHHGLQVEKSRYLGESRWKNVLRRVRHC
jgi:hypothetical protein